MIGREKEVQKLTELYNSSEAEFVAIYGRRRVGKTYLVEQTYADYFAFRATGVESGNTRTQLKSFKQRLAVTGVHIGQLARFGVEHGYPKGHEHVRAVVLAQYIVGFCNNGFKIPV